MKMKNKLFLILLFILFFIGMNNSSNAVLITDETYKALYDEGIQAIIDNSDYDDYIDSMKDFVVFRNGVWNYLVYTIDNENYNSNSFCVVSREDEFVDYYVNCNAVIVSFQDSRNYYSVLMYSNGGGGSFPIENSLQFSTVDIYCYESKDDVLNNTNGTLFFQAPPQILSLEEVTLEAQQTAGKITQEVLREELAELVPVGIMILAAMTTVFLIAYWNFWKK